jgi:hypothetical protein
MRTELDGEMLWTTKNRKPTLVEVKDVLGFMVSEVRSTSHNTRASVRGARVFKNDRADSGSRRQLPARQCLGTRRGQAGNDISFLAVESRIEYVGCERGG